MTISERLFACFLLLATLRCSDPTPADSGSGGGAGAEGPGSGTVAGASTDAGEGGTAGEGTSGATPSGRLVNGGRVVGPDGVVVRALPDTLEAAIDILIAHAERPAEPLPDETLAIGPFYELRSDQRRSVPTSSPFVLSFPVPEGADTQHLAVAVRVPSESVLDGDRSGWEWSLLQGTYDAAEQRFVTTIPFLSADGRVFVLVTDPWVSSLEKPPSIAFSRLPDGADVPVSRNEVGAPPLPFVVQCDAQVSCPDSMKDDITALFEQVRAEFRATGFDREPRLRVQLDPTGENGSSNPTGFLVYVSPPASDRCVADGGRRRRGVYRHEETTIDLCVAGPDENGRLPFEYRSTVVHEYFHALQFAYDGVGRDADQLYTPGRYELFFIEGTATAAENSYLNDGLTLRAELAAWRRVDVELRASWLHAGFSDKAYEYQAQDFWVYEGLRTLRDLDFVIPILERGASLEDIDAGLPQGLGATYWAWAKNQAFERHIHLNGLNTVLPCHVDPKVFEQADVPGITWTWFPRSAQPLEGRLKPLSSVIVRIEHLDGFAELITITETKSPTDPALRYKVYSEFEARCSDTVDEGERTLDTRGAFGYGQPNRFYVLVSNLSPTEEKTFRLLGTGKAAGADEEPPDDGTGDEGDPGSDPGNDPDGGGGTTPPLPPCSVVSFVDAALESAVRGALGVSSGPIPADRAAQMPFLFASARGIESLAGIECLRNVQRVELAENRIVDIGPLAALRQLEHIDLSENDVVDLAPLADLQKLAILRLDANQITDITPLAALAGLEELQLGSNSVSSIQALRGLGRLTILDLHHNEGITDLSALAPLSALERLELAQIFIQDPSVLFDKPALTWLDLRTTGIQNIDFLAEYTDLEILVLTNNPVGDISVLEQLTSLDHVDLDHTPVTDIRPLANNLGLTDGDTVFVQSMSWATCQAQLDAVQALLARGVVLLAQCA